MTKKKLLVFDFPEYAKPFLSVYDVFFADTPEKLQQGIEECDTVLFTGGSDVSPHLYGEQRHATTVSNLDRDKFEVHVYKRALAKKKSFLGICRGAQFLCVMAGGKLIQDVTGHTQSHMIEDGFGNKLLMTSTHHQMMHPVGTDCIKIAWAKYPQSKHYFNGEGGSYFMPFAHEEPEIIYFKEIDALAIQGHPECSSDPMLHEYCCSLVKFFLFKEQDKHQPYYPGMNPAV